MCQSPVQTFYPVSDCKIQAQHVDVGVPKRLYSAFFGLHSARAVLSQWLVFRKDGVVTAAQYAALAAKATAAGQAVCSIKHIFLGI